MGGLPVSDDVRRIVTEEWYKMSRGGTLNVVVKDVIDKAKPKIIREKLTPPSSHTTYNNIIKELRNLPPEKKRLLDRSNKPWNLDNSRLAPDTIPYVLQLWRYSINLDEVFTIRQANWASKLCYLINKLDIAEQWVHTLRYAKEEELSFLSSTSMRLIQLNSLLIMGESELFTLRETDNHFKVNSKLNNSIFIAHAPDGGVIEEYLHTFSDVYNTFMEFILGDRTNPSNFEGAYEIVSLIDSLPSSSKYFPDFESRMVYLRHLSALSKLPYFKTAEPKQIIELLVDLRNWISSEINLKDEATTPQIKKPSQTTKAQPQTHKGKLKRMHEPLWSGPSGSDGILIGIIQFPLDIYLRAGFSLDEDQKQIEEELRKKYKSLGEN
jgi:hypothetical protein